MKYKLIPMKDGKVDLSLNELSGMLENAYDDGYKDGKESMPKANPFPFEPAWTYKRDPDGLNISDPDMFRVHYDKPNAVWYGPDWDSDWNYKTSNPDWTYKPSSTTASPDTYDSDYIVVNSDTYTTSKGSNDTTTECNGENITFTKILEDLLKK